MQRRRRRKKRIIIAPILKFNPQRCIIAIGEVPITRTIDSHHRSFTRDQKPLVQLVHQTRLCTLAAEYGVEVASDVGLISEAKQIEEISIDFHILNVVEALRQEEDVQFVVVTVHGEELEEAFTLTTMLETHDMNVINDHIGVRLNFHLLYGLWHDTVVLKVFHTLSAILFW